MSEERGKSKEKEVFEGDKTPKFRGSQRKKENSKRKSKNRPRENTEIKGSFSDHNVDSSNPDKLNNINNNNNTTSTNTNTNTNTNTSAIPNDTKITTRRRTRGSGMSLEQSSSESSITFGSERDSPSFIEHPKNSNRRQNRRAFDRGSFELNSENNSSDSSIIEGSKPSHLPTTKRFTVFPNGLKVGGKVVIFPISFSDWPVFLRELSKRIGIEVEKIYNEDGGEIDEYDIITHDDVVHVTSRNQTFKPPVNETGELRGSSDWVTLNVGGRVFSTTRSTLTRDSDSMLAKMFSERWNSSKDATGSFLIDRTPEYFAPILNFLRCGVLVIDDGVNPEGVLQEARFFNISAIIDRLKLLVERKNKADVFSRRDVVSILLTSSTNASLRCQGLNLAGVDLSKLDLSHINFKMTNFQSANLSKCTLDNALLQEADLTNADLSGANLRGSNLSSAILEGANLKGANFEDRGGLRATLDGANFKGAILEEVNFSGANLRVANFRGANMENCSLRGADLAGANLEDANLRGANLHKANLIGANLRGANFDIRTVSSR